MIFKSKSLIKVRLSWVCCFYFYYYTLLDKYREMNFVKKI